MTRKQLEDLFLIVNDIVYTPIYSYDDFIFNEETQEYEYINLVIYKTAQEVYDEWLSNKDKPIEQLKDKISILEDLSAYKHEYIEWMDYDGYKQRCWDSDLLKIAGARDTLLNQETTSVNWYHPTGRVTVSDYMYFENMIKIIKPMTQRAYDTAYELAQEINALTDEQLQTYDMRKRFDEMYKTL
ncbi:MAG: hypothetical protein ACRDD7_07445 [Peptostreptococcaceae bacterium]